MELKWVVSRVLGSKCLDILELLKLESRYCTVRAMRERSEQIDRINIEICLLPNSDTNKWCHYYQRKRKSLQWYDGTGYFIMQEVSVQLWHCILPCIFSSFDGARSYFKISSLLSLNFLVTSTYNCPHQSFWCRGIHFVNIIIVVILGVLLKT